MSDKTSGGGSFTDALTIALIVLKLCGVITWSWVWVLFPLWASVALDVIVLIIASLVQGRRK